MILIFTKDINMKKVHAKTVPTNISGEQKRKFLRFVKTITIKTYSFLRRADLGLPVFPRNRIPKDPIINDSIYL